MPLVGSLEDYGSQSEKGFRKIESSLLLAGAVFQSRLRLERYFEFVRSSSKSLAHKKIGSEREEKHCLVIKLVFSLRYISEEKTLIQSLSAERENITNPFVLCTVLCFANRKKC